MADERTGGAGRPAWLAQTWAMKLSPVLAEQAADAEAAGHTVVFCGWDGEVRGFFAVADAVRPTSAEAVARLRRWGCGRCC